MGLVALLLADTRRLCLVWNPPPRLGLQDQDEKIALRARLQLSQPELKDKPMML